MKKIGLVVKETSGRIIKQHIKDANGVFIIKYSGLSGPDLNALRINLKGSNASFFVVKNSVARRALTDAGMQQVIATIDGPCGFVFAKDEPVNISRILYAFLKDHEKLQVEGGFLKDKVLAKKDVEVLSKLPSKEALRAKVVVTLNAPISGFVIVLNQTLKKFVYCLDQIKNKKTS